MGALWRVYVAARAGLVRVDSGGGHKSWWKILSASDLSASLTVSASHVKLVTFAGAGQIGRTSSQSGLTIQNNGVGAARGWGAAVVGDGAGDVAAGRGVAGREQLVAGSVRRRV